MSSTSVLADRTSDNQQSIIFMKYPVIALTAATLLCVTPLLQAELSITIETVDIIDNSNRAAWWSPIAYDAGDGSVYATYLRPNPWIKDDDVYIARRDANGKWSTFDTGGDAWHDPGHTQSSIAIDGDGYVHLFYGMHHEPIKYRRSYAARNLAAGFKYLKPDAIRGNFTYPNLTAAPNGDVYLGIRDHPQGQLYRYDVQARKWSLAAVYAGQEQTTVYPDQFLADSQGNIHIIWEWAAGGPQASRHNGSYALYKPSAQKFYRADGIAYDDTPIRMDHADIFQGLEGHETFAHRVHGYQSAKMTLDEANRPIVAYAYSTNQEANGYQFRMARWDGTQWQRSVVVDGPFSLDKPWITQSEGQLRYYGTVSPDDPLHTGSDDIFLRMSDDNGKTWSHPVQVTDGLSVQRPVGITADGIDYLYLPSMSDNTLYVARIVANP